MCWRPGNCHDVLITCYVARSLVIPSWGGECHSRWSQPSLSVPTHSIRAQERERVGVGGEEKHEQHSKTNQTFFISLFSDGQITANVVRGLSEPRVGKYPRVMTPGILGSCTYHYHSTFLIPVTGL